MSSAFIGAHLVTGRRGRNTTGDRAARIPIKHIVLILAIIHQCLIAVDTLGLHLKSTETRLQAPTGRFQTATTAFIPSSISQQAYRNTSHVNAQRWSYTRVTLLKDTPHVGKQGDVAIVNRNYAFNYLVPFGFARYTTRAELIGLTLQKDYREALTNVRKASAMHLKTRLGDDTVLRFDIPAEEAGSDKLLTPLLPIHIIDKMRQKKMLLAVDMLREQDIKILTEDGVISNFGLHKVILNVDPEINIEIGADVKEQPVDTGFIKDLILHDS
ncbi:50s ribosomal protein L9 [Babesia ovis]|uniref:50s ribosomal protein L9 n=1 Tax=Babesia ovis TaxID=5869 RepID=A0A9W5WTV1_BABOV|nr:50s ribosomal protein L9 [Babesia ovis]